MEKLRSRTMKQMEDTRQFAVQGFGQTCLFMRRQIFCTAYEHSCAWCRLL